VGTVRNGADPAGRIFFGQWSRDDDIGQVVAPLFAIDPDGSDLTRVLDCDIERPRVSHDGTRLAFGIVMDDGSWQVATSRVDGTDLRILTSTTGYAQTPDWSPDDSWLVYGLTARCTSPTCWDDGTSREVLWRMNTDGTDQRRIGNPAAFDREPRLSPDGREVVFDRADRSNPVGLVLTIRDLASGVERRVFAKDLDPEHLEWSPDGRWFVFNDADGRDLQQIKRMPTDDPTATPEVLYGDADHHGIKPTYSPDGSNIVFGCNGMVCRMNADGTNVKVLVEAAAGVPLNHFAWGVNPR